MGIFLRALGASRWHIRSNQASLSRASIRSPICRAAPRSPQPAFPPQARSQCFAVYVRHDEKHECADLFDRVNRNDVWVGELRRHAGLAYEPLAPPRDLGELGRQQLDRDDALEAQVACAVHDRHPAPAQLALKRVAARNGGLEIEEQAVGRAPPRWTHAPYTSRPGHRRHSGRRFCRL